MLNNFRCHIIWLKMKLLGFLNVLSCEYCLVVTVHEESPAGFHSVNGKLGNGHTFYEALKKVFSTR